MPSRHPAPSTRARHGRSGNSKRSTDRRSLKSIRALLRDRPTTKRQRREADAFARTFDPRETISRLMANPWVMPTLPALLAAYELVAERPSEGRVVLAYLSYRHAVLTVMAERHAAADDRAIRKRQILAAVRPRRKR